MFVLDIYVSVLDVFLKEERLKVFGVRKELSRFFRNLFGKIMVFGLTFLLDLFRGKTY